MMADSTDAERRRDLVRDEPAGTLLSRLLADLTALGKNEIELAKTEFRAVLEDFKTGIASLALAAAVLLTGFLALVAAGVLALAQVVTAWLAALLVGGALTVVGVLLTHAARRKLVSPGTSMDRTQHSLEKDATVVARRA